MSTIKKERTFSVDEIIAVDSNRYKYLQKQYYEKGFDMDKQEKAEMFRLNAITDRNNDINAAKTQKEMAIIFKLILPTFLAGMIGIFVYFSATSSNGYLYGYLNPITKTTVAEVEVTKKVADRNTGWFCDKKAGIIYMDGVAVWKNGCTH